MSQYGRSASQRVPSPHLGALEITAFDGTPANDNGSGLPRPKSRKSAGWRLPAAAFVSGLTAALLVSGLSDLLGITS